MQVQLVEGRLPKNSNEIILSEEIAKTASVANEIGDVIHVATGTRESHHGEFEMPPNSNVSLHVVEGEVEEAYDMNILVVEDDKTISLGLEYSLQQEGYETFARHDVQAAKQLIDQR